MVRTFATPIAVHGIQAAGAQCSRRCSLTVGRSVFPCASSASDIGNLADGFVAEYELAGFKLEPLAKRQLRDWYATELQRASPTVTGADAGGETSDGATVVAPASKKLPPLMQRRPGIPQLTVMWDLESVKPFTQQHRTEPADAAANDPEQQPRVRTGVPGARPARLAAAGLPVAGSSPDLIGALDQLCRTLKPYGTLHAVHLFLRESTLGKAPVLRRQVQQLRTWVGLRGEGGKGEEEGEQRQEEERKAAGGGATDHVSVVDTANTALVTPSSSSSSMSDRGRTTGSGEQGRSGVGGVGRRRLFPMLPLDGDVHDCPMCRTAYPNRLDLLRHFAAAHQGPLLAATAADTRTHIMWTRGRPVGLPVASRSDPRVGDAAPSADPTATNGDTIMEKAIVSPEEFAYARDLVMRGRHLDELLATAPVAEHSVAPGPPAAAAGANHRGPERGPTGLGTTVPQPQPDNARKAGGSGGGSSTAGRGGGGLSRCGLHIHLVPAGQPAEAAAEALRQAVEALAAEQASSAAVSPFQRSGGRSSTQQPAGRAAEPQGRGRKGARKSRVEEKEELEDAPVVCVCVVSDAEGLDQILAGLRQQDVLAMAVTRVSRVPSADVSLRWWAVQGGEYRQPTGRQG